MWKYVPVFQKRGLHFTRDFQTFDKVSLLPLFKHSFPHRLHRLHRAIPIAIPTPSHPMYMCAVLAGVLWGCTSRINLKVCWMMKQNSRVNY